MSHSSKLMRWKKLKKLQYVQWFFDRFGTLREVIVLAVLLVIVWIWETLILKKKCFILAVNCPTQWCIAGHSLHLPLCCCVSLVLRKGLLAHPAEKGRLRWLTVNSRYRAAQTAESDLSERRWRTEGWRREFKRTRVKFWVRICAEGGEGRRLRKGKRIEDERRRKEGGEDMSSKGRSTETTRWTNGDR